MLSGYLNNSITNINHTLSDFLDNVNGDFNQKFGTFTQKIISAGLDPKDFDSSACVDNFDITRLIPTWVISEKHSKQSSGEANVISVFDFLQKYYDWLYCDLPEGAQYALGENLLNIIDVQRTREEFIGRIYNTYFHSFPFDDVKNDPDLALDLQKARDFIVDIRKNLHGRKTNLEAINYFFTRLFSISEEDIIVYYPKTDILRLNGGMFSNQFFNFTSATGNFETGTALGSGLNISRFQDNDWFHDWSYLVFLNNQQENETLKKAYIQSLHPAGLRLVFGKQISDYQGPGTADETSVVCEFPMLKNYAPYSMTLTYGEVGNKFGITLFGLTGCSGCNGSYHVPAATGFTGPVFVLPTWTGDIPQTRFFDINIVSFLQLCHSSGLTSPNETKSCLNC